jgi:hypothetical protein
MTSDDSPVEIYLDALLDRLRGEPREIRRALSEAEDHLYSAVTEATQSGTERHQAETDAVAAFGTSAVVAAAFNSAGPSTSGPRMWRALAGQLTTLAGIGLVAIGLSGGLERAMTAAWGRVFVFADPTGTQYPASACRYWESIHPHATGCTQAAIAESMADGLVQRYAAGVIGVVILLLVAAIGRRQGTSLAGALAAPVPIVIGAASFTVAAVVFVALGLDRIRIANGNGAGQWLSAAVLSVMFAAAYLTLFWQRARHRGVPTWILSDRRSSRAT